MKETIKDLAEAVEAWITSHTRINPSRARQAVLDTLIWAEGEAKLQGLTIPGLLKRCTPTDYASNQWNRRKYAGRSRSDLAPDHQCRAHCIGRAQPPGESSPRWWYVVPPEIPPGLDQLGIPCPDLSQAGALSQNDY